ncbi:MAG: histidine phosphatase family protein [Firmicutes bacterium]|nr:histidine phosphatase family protein [Bacillota bacterium]
MTLLYLVRHGETDWNRTMRIQGHSDIELNDHGVAQARRLGARLARWPIDRAIASDLVRAQETARLALGDRAIPLELDERLRERNFGEWEGLTREEVEARDPEGARRWREEPWTFRPPGGESLADVARRALPVVEELREEGGRVLIVSHGGTLRAILRHLLGWPDGSGPKLFLFNTGLTVIRLGPERVRLERLNDIGHLEIEPAVLDPREA